MRSGCFVLVVLASACEKPSPPRDPRFDGPMPVVFGDCAAATVAWFSGPRPSSAEDVVELYGGLIGPESEMSGGFGSGRSGPRPGGGGWGTIGTGRYGTIGRGSGWHKGGEGRAGGLGVVQLTGSGSVTPAPRSVFRTAIATRVDTSKYQPGADNPLRAERAALEACFRRNPVHHGVAVVELGYDAAGRTTGAVVHGLDDEHTRSCVSAAARRVMRAQRAGSELAAERCAMSFGEMPLAALPAIDLDTDAIRLAGKTVATPSAIASDPDTPQVAGVVDAVRARVRAAIASAAPVVAIDGPLIVRPIDAMPMKIVTRVLASVLAAGDDFVLARRAGNASQLLAPMALPVVPVPQGTGGRWNRLTRTPTARIGISSPLLLRITKQQISITESNAKQLVVLPRDPAELEQELKRVKASAAIADGGELEITVDDDVPYGDVANVIAAATQVGFRDWNIAVPSNAWSSQ
jgi:hypothetical protein